MSETTASTTPTTEPPADGAKPDADQALGEGGKKALSEERAARKAAEAATTALQKQLDEITRSQMSDLERAQAAAADAQKLADQHAADALRWRIAARHGISDEDAETFLTGSDEATLTRQAERLSAMAAASPTTPKPDLTQGGTGQPHALNGDGLESALRNKLGIA